MMISTKGRYALRVMLDLAGHMEDGYIPLAEIAAQGAQHPRLAQNREDAL